MTALLIGWAVACALVCPMIYACCVVAGRADRWSEAHLDAPTPEPQGNPTP